MACDRLTYTNMYETRNETADLARNLAARRTRSFLLKHPAADSQRWTVPVHRSVALVVDALALAALAT